MFLSNLSNKLSVDNFWREEQLITHSQETDAAALPNKVAQYFFRHLIIFSKRCDFGGSVV